MGKNKSLLDKYILGEATPEEKFIVESGYLDFNKDINSISPKELDDEYLLVLKRINNQINKKQNILYLRIFSAAAAILISLTITFLFYKKEESPSPEKILAKTDLKTDVILTLSNGHKVNLSDTNDNELIEEAGVIVKRSSNGEIAYTYSGADTKNITSFNTVETPVGSSFCINLPDGSKVWLNSTSKLKYPLAFNSKERVVVLEGEAYFEVKKTHTENQIQQRFKVVSKDQVVEVLGTHFNVRAYSNEELIKTTLLEGSINVKTPVFSKMLKPGEQSILKKDKDKFEISKINLEDAIAWKNGYFSFNEIDIRTFINDLKRWYDIDVEYVGDIHVRKITGTFSRSKKLSELLMSIEDLGDYKFKIEGRRVIVMSN
ncbi:FecR family protein [Pedobacter sp. ASV1-7]|uniref:FecR family protein n=1 Tax=Pedobacter sp. ASV1-7 TaxID=3145237 RepID=UPI0032E88551